MIRINRQTDYAVRVVLSLAKRGPDHLIPTSQIQKEMSIPPALAQRIVADLARGGFITTHPGRDGGLALARASEMINLRQVVEHFEGPLVLSDCLVARGQCQFDRVCPVHCHWARLQLMLVGELEDITFAQLAQDAWRYDSVKSAGSSTGKKPARTSSERSKKPGNVTKVIVSGT
jgi:Rrf2 family nitric oxide-sensitive transcriptional repressor